ncbi:MAG: MjaI family restriction endonuclease [Bernardetiaceae bacterium]|nr:MjaI family restriction endonuclease [Bernardetiaceae bacterium]
MAKEWILNSAMNRFQLNFKRNVGPTSESIRKCEPKSLEEWRAYYFENVRPKLLYSYSAKIDGKKTIVNQEIVSEIKSEIDRLSQAKTQG